MRENAKAWKRPAAEAGKYLLAALYTALTIGPLVWVLSMSVKTTDEIRLSPYALPKNWRFDLYGDVWNNSGYNAYFGNSILVVGAAILMILLITSMSAYCFSKLPFKGSELLFTAVFSAIMLPAQILIIPLYQDLAALRLINSRMGLSLVYVAVQMPISTYILRSFFATIPNELREAAKIDGCSELKTFFRIMLPIAKPALSTILIINFINLWNEFLFASVLIQKDAMKTLPLGIIKFVGDVNEDLGRIAASVVIAIAPVILIYCIFSENFMKGMTAGAVKG
ncbi:MAG: carbohydrate ABC transporter permease [Candidatus Limiplasma sp.]|nr:carbohydrate ABC transporter permease [Candidatus Limiplasma sp.]